MADASELGSACAELVDATPRLNAGPGVALESVVVSRDGLRPMVGSVAVSQAETVTAPSAIANAIILGLMRRESRKSRALTARRLTQPPKHRITMQNPATWRDR
jgi:hypothetical protein